MNWLLFILRVVFGLPLSEPRDPQRVAIRPDGSTTTLLPDDSRCQGRTPRWDWLLPHFFWRHRFLILRSVVDSFASMFRRRTFPSHDARPGNRQGYRR
jgi:hypothetical protein